MADTAERLAAAWYGAIDKGAQWGRAAQQRALHPLDALVKMMQQAAPPKKETEKKSTGE